MCCLSLLCCSRLKSNWDHKRPYISPTHSILESLTWSTYIHHQSSSYIPCILLIFFCIDHPWSFVRDPGLMGCGRTRSLVTQRSRLQSCKVSDVLYLTVSYCPDSEGFSRSSMFWKQPCPVAVLSLRFRKLRGWMGQGHWEPSRHLLFHVPLPPACQLRAWH